MTGVTIPPTEAFQPINQPEDAMPAAELDPDVPFSPTDSQKPTSELQPGVDAPAAIDDRVTAVPESSPATIKAVEPLPKDNPSPAAADAAVVAAQANADKVAEQTDKLTGLVKPTKGRIVLVTQADIGVDGEVEFPAIVTMVYQQGNNTTIRVTAFPPNGHELPIDTALHVDDPAPGKSRWRWPPRE